MNCGFTVRKKEEFTLTHCTAVWKNISWKHLCNLKVWKNTEIYILSDLDKHFVKILFLLQNTVWKIKPSHTTVWKNQKFSLTKNFFREINYLVTSLVKMMFSRNFCQKSEKENFRNFHSTLCTLWKFTLTQFWQKFRESNGFTKEVTK